MRFGTTFLVLSFAATPLLAGPFTDFDFGGTCTRRNTQVIENGDALAVLLDNFGVRMPQGEDGDGLQTIKTCWMRLRVKPPRGQYLAGLEQVYRGGLVKSAKSSARMTLRYNLVSIDREHQARTWPAGREVRPEDERSSFEFRIDDSLGDARCGKMAIFGVHMVFAASRPNRNGEFVLGSLDTVDMQLTRRRIELKPRWKACRDR